MSSAVCASSRYKSLALVVFAWKCCFFCLCTHVQCRVCYIYHVESHFRFRTVIISGKQAQTSENIPSVPCEHNKHGFCRTHRTLSKQIEVTKSTWKDRGGGKGFGFVKSMVKKFICPDKNKSPVTPLNIPMFDNYSASNISRHVGQGRENNENIHTSRKLHSGISDNIAAGLERRNQVKEWKREFLEGQDFQKS